MRILFYGDSNTWGFNAQTGMRFENRFTALLQKRMPHDTIIECGLCGRTICHDDPYALEQRNGAKTIAMELKTHVPLDLVVIMLGTNDAKRHYGTNALFSAEKGMDILLHEALDLNNFKHAEKIPRFLVLCPPKMHPDYQKNIRTLTNFGQEGYQMIETIALQLQPVCQKWKVDFKELDNIIAGSFDGLHLDETGHQKISEQLLLILEDYR